MDCPLCGAVEETVTYFVTEYVLLEGVSPVREQFGVTRGLGGSIGGNIAFQRGEGEKCKDLYISSAGT